MGRTTSKRRNAVVVTERFRSGAAAWVSAWLFLLRSVDGRLPEPYLLPMPYAVALRAFGETVRTWGELDETGAMPAVPLRSVA